MKTAITLSLLPNSPGMPFVLGPDLEEGFRVAADLQFDAVEIFPPTLESIDARKIGQLCTQHSLRLSTIGTGGGAVAQGLTLTDDNADVRKKARDYVRGVIQKAGDLGGAAIIGSMQGKAAGRPREEVLKFLGEALTELGDYARQWNQTLLYEPLNRYETDLVNRIGDASELLQQFDAGNTKILADLFHMNIEESDIVATINDHLQHIGHVHFVDSNRWPAGGGHTNLEAPFLALQRGGFDGYLAVEAFPLPDQHTAAQCAAAEFSRLFAKRDCDSQTV